MRKLIALSSGEYSDYSVNSFWEVDHEVTEDELKAYWKESIKQETYDAEYRMKRIADYLEIPIQQDSYGVVVRVGRDKYAEALKAVAHPYRNFMDEIMTQHGFKELEFEEFNVDTF